MWMTAFQMLVLLTLLYATSATCKQLVRSIAGVPPFGGDNRLAVNARLLEPNSIFITDKNEVYISDIAAHTVRKIDKNGIISTIAGLGGENGYSGDGDVATKCTLDTPTSVQVTPSGEVFIADYKNYAIRKIFQNGTITTIAGGNGEGIASQGESAKNAKFRDIQSIFYAYWSDELFISDSINRVIWKMLSNGTLITVVGIPGIVGYNGNFLSPLETSLVDPQQVFVTRDEEVYFAEKSLHVVRRVFNNTVSIVAGIPYNSNFNGHSKSVYPATAATLAFPRGVFVSEITGDVYVVDTGNVIVRKIFNNTLITVSGKRNVGQFVLSSYTGDGGKATDATIGYPVNAALNRREELFSVDSISGVVRKVALDGFISTFAGWSAFNPSVDPELLSQSINGPSYIQLTSDNTLYVLEGGAVKILQDGKLVNINIGLSNLGFMYINEAKNELYALDMFKLYKVDLQSRNITVLAGGDALGFSGDGGPANQALLQQPSSIYIANNNDIYIADSYNHCIRKITYSTGVISRVAGIGGVHSFGYNGDDIPATDALLHTPTQVRLDEDTGELYIADAANNRMRKIGTDGNIVTIANINTYHFIFDEQKNIIFSNAYFSTIEKWYRNGTIEVLIGKRGPINAFTADGNDPKNTKFYNPTYFFFAPNNVVYVSDGNNNLIRKISTMCKDYAIRPSFQFSLNNDNLLKVTTAAEITCESNSDQFLEEYLPLVEMKFKSTGNELKTLVSDWGKNKSFETSVSEQYLDIIELKLNGCNENKGLLFSNCSSVKEFGIVPSSSKSTFFFESQATGVRFINYFSKSNSVADFGMRVQFANLNTNQIDKVEYFSAPYTTASITGLRHSTSYNVSIVTHVSYSNNITLKSAEVHFLISTQIGVVPSASVQNVQLLAQGSVIIISWAKIPEQERGNIEIQKLEIQVTTNATFISTEQISSLESIPYSAASNSPSIYLYTISKFDTSYEFRIRACNEVGCGVFSEPKSEYISSPSVSNLGSIIAGVVILFLVIFLCIIAVVIVVIVISLITVLVIKKQKKTDLAQNQIQDTELLDQIVSKEFKIEESKLDFSQSVFIGSGASGSVITAKYFNIDVAVKLIRKNNMGMDSDMTDFYNELKFMNQNAHHQNIIRFFGVYQNEEKIGLVMELCKNGSVASYISKLNVNFTTKVDFIKGIANGMRYLHHFNIAHRDLKCENVLLDESLTPKIIDFGFSREIEANANRSLNLTMNIGTAAYCAPEVLQLQLSQLTLPIDGSSSNENISKSSMSSDKRLAYDKKCDVYSFAIIIYVIYFQNKNPYGNVTDNQIMFQLSKNINFRPKYDESNIPANEKWLIELMIQCWKTNPEERYSFEQICDYLEKRSS